MIIENNLKYSIYYSHLFSQHCFNNEKQCTVGPCIVRPKYPKKSAHYAKSHYASAWVAWLI